MMRRICSLAFDLALVLAEATPAAAGPLQIPGSTRAAVDPPRYCSDRQIVALEMECDTLGAVQRATVIESYAGRRQVDSLVALAPSWRVPLGASRPKAIYKVTIAVNRIGKERMTRSLPDDDWPRFETGPLGAWMQALHAADPSTSLGDFVALSPTTLAAPRQPQALQGESMRRRQAFGMLHESPGGTYVLDPFMGSDVTPEGTLASDVDVGFAVFDMPSGDHRCYRLTTRDGIHLVDWIGPASFVLVGTSLMSCGSSGEFRVPAIWFGDVAECRLVHYVGNPMTPWQWDEYYARIHEVWKGIYPRLRAEY